MRNLEQIRASNALAYANAGQNMRGQEGGNVLKKLPALVMGNGLLAAGAFAYGQKSDSGWRTCFDHIAKHLAHQDIRIVPQDKNSTDSLMKFLSDSDSQTLKLATDEALAWLSYARRFERKGDHHNEDDE